jgi:hypothetical protein
MIGMDDDEAGGGGWVMPEVVDKNDESIKAKFGIDGPQSKETVGKVFNTLHAFIQAGGLKDYPDVIKTGDWIDLEGGLKVDAYGGISSSYSDTDENKGAISLAAGSGDPNPKLRLVVVGINSFQKGKGSGDNYTVEANDGVDHVVFHFKDVPGQHQMRAPNTNSTGYENSRMREYVTGNFLDGLENAGVPKGVLWRPKRYVSAGINGSGASELSDLLWLPTERELFGDGPYTEKEPPYTACPLSADGETAENQARLEYYSSDALRGKLGMYWISSVRFADWALFCGVLYTGIVSANGAPVVLDCAPAFCVK